MALPVWLRSNIDEGLEQFRTWHTRGDVLKGDRHKLGTHMGKLIRALFFLLFFLAIGLVSYAYIGPIFGADFSAPQDEIRQSVTLDGK